MIGNENKTCFHAHLAVHADPAAMRFHL